MKINAEYRTRRKAIKSLFVKRFIKGGNVMSSSQ